MDTIKSRLKQLRKKLAMTQAEFAAKLGIAQNSYSQIETGKAARTDKNIRLICYTFGVSEIWLIEGKGEMFGKVSSIVGTREEQLLDLFRQLSPEMQDAIFNHIRSLVEAEITRRIAENPEGIKETPKTSQEIKKGELTG
jgi:transcriptional regulator with XRE-family HTH domain